MPAGERVAMELSSHAKTSSPTSQNRKLTLPILCFNPKPSHSLHTVKTFKPKAKQTKTIPFPLKIPSRKPLFQQEGYSFFFILSSNKLDSLNSKNPDERKPQ